jgi:thiamine-phosphate pyrophosphorylase
LLLYYITDRAQFLGDEKSRRQALLHKVAEAASGGVDLIQLRENDLCTRELEDLALAAVRTIRENSPQTRLLINSRTDIAIACGADGVHLRSNDVSPADVRLVWQGRAISVPESRSRPHLGVSCHTREDVARAVSGAADFVVFGPVFEKQGIPNSSPAGIAALREACRQKIPVIALGGVTAASAATCMDAGAAGVAGIRLFQENDVAELARRLRG